MGNTPVARSCRLREFAELLPPTGGYQFSDLKDAP
jgi:hypothetical protein